MTPDFHAWWFLSGFPRQPLFDEDGFTPTYVWWKRKPWLGAEPVAAFAPFLPEPSVLRPYTALPFPA